METLPITSLMAGIFALMMVPLSLAVSMRRVKVGNVVFGDAGDETLRNRNRAHGNFVEYVPTGLIALALVECGGGSSTLVWSLAGAFLFSRVLHAGEMLFIHNAAPRGAAMMVGHAFFAVCGGWLVYHAV